LRGSKGFLVTVLQEKITTEMLISLLETLILKWIEIITMVIVNKEINHLLIIKGDLKGLKDLNMTINLHKDKDN